MLRTLAVGSLTGAIIAGFWSYDLMYALLIAGGGAAILVALAVLGEMRSVLPRGSQSLFVSGRILALLMATLIGCHLADGLFGSGYYSRVSVDSPTKCGHVVIPPPESRSEGGTSAPTGKAAAEEDHPGGFWTGLWNRFVSLFINEEDAVFLTSPVEVYTAPGPAARLKYMLYPPTPVVRLATQNDQWIRIRCDSLEGWVRTKEGLFSEKAPSVTCVVRPGKGKSNIRRGPSLEAPVIARVIAGTQLKYLRTSADGTWGKVRMADQQTGWISQRLIKVKSLSATLKQGQ